MPLVHSRDSFCVGNDEMGATSAVGRSILVETTEIKNFRNRFLDYREKQFLDRSGPSRRLWIKFAVSPTGATMIGSSPDELVFRIAPSTRPPNLQRSDMKLIALRILWPN